MNIHTENEAPEPPFLVVSNHLSYLDIFVLFSQLRCLFVAKSDVKAWPLAGFIIRTCGILFIDRNRKRDVKRVNSLISRNINENQGIILFPEGTTSPGIEILPLKTSLLNYPASQSFPVHYVTLSYQTKDPDYPAHTHVCWWQDISFVHHFWEFLKIKETHVSMKFGKSGIVNADRKQLAETLHKKMSGDLKPVITASEFYKKHDDYKSMLPV
ncbi:lysophospholipid acyltransferase family protein [Gracilimonas mengyeensis]|uniref:lysophospholipid acyltransferase family protein n=1 Tax=Gracilimonas mengyeensis TaxID=1302730 RepID=UPI00163DA77F|nr:lysophospholipid acyltransferase family protein [Gracilimonas mengyeensis]